MPVVRGFQRETQLLAEVTAGFTEEMLSKLSLMQRYSFDLE